MIGFKKENHLQLPGPATISCPHCAKAIPVITHALAAYVSCGHCQKLFTTRENPKGLLQKFSLDYQFNPVLPIGTKGRIKDEVYAVVGFAKFKEATAAYYWREYVLFSPVHGYGLLAEYDGHWNFFRFISDYAPGNSFYKTITYHDQDFNLYNKYRSTVLYAEGEFFWDIREGNTEYQEFVAPPLMLTRMQSRHELSWMLGEYLEPEVVQMAFCREKHHMPAQSGVGAAEPFSASFSFKAIRNVALLAVALLFVFQVLFSSSCEEKQLHSGTYTIPDHAITNTLGSQAGPTITIPNTLSGNSNLEFKLRAPVNNNWFATEITLINTQTHREHSFEMGVEYYSGYESGSSWSEGDQSEDKIISSLSAGTYQVILQPYRESYSSVNSFDLAIIHDVPIWSNFWVTLGLIILFPGIQWLREYSFEKRRWMDSDYSPYE